MNKLLLALLASIPFSANATWPSSELTQTQNQSQNQSAQGGSGSASSDGQSVDIDNRLQIPTTPPAIAPAQSVNAICQIATPQSNAVSFLFFSASQTNGVKYNALCLALQNNDKELAHQIACDTLSDYKAANLKLGRECK